MGARLPHVDRALTVAVVDAEVLVVDRGESVGETWRSRYDRLHLHTPRIQSSLPGVRIPGRFGRWVAKDDMAEYLRAYARRQRIAPRFATEVRRVDHDGRVWTATFDEGTLSAALRARTAI